MFVDRTCACSQDLPCFATSDFPPYSSCHQKQMTALGKLIVVSGPSGSGKSTLLDRLFADPPPGLRRAVSATTRAPRPGEEHGRDYHFLSLEEFTQRRAAGKFLEDVEVYPGRWYGTLKSEVEPSLGAGESVVLEIDVRGADQARREYPHAVSIFVQTRSLEELESRLRKRMTETDADIAGRLETARREITFADQYDHRVINDDPDQAMADLRGIINQTLGNAR